jgi:hypothetical protein
MNATLVQEIEDLMHSAPYSAVDIEPLVLRNTNGMTIEEAARVRIKILGILRQLEQMGDLQMDQQTNFALAVRQGGQFIHQGPIYIKGTVQFERRFKDILPLPSPAIHVAGDNNIVTAGDNNTITSSQNKINLSESNLTQEATPGKLTETKRGGLRYWITENPLVTGVIGGILALVIGTLILLKLGVIH